MAFPCGYCSSFAGSTFKKLLNHIKFIHSHEPNFLITCGDCGQSFNNFNSFKSHIQRKHNEKELAVIPGVIDENEDINIDDDDNISLNSSDHEDLEEEVDTEEEAKNYTDEMTRFLALFILKTKEENQLSQRGIDAILDNTGDLVESSGEHLKEQITTCLERNGVEVGDVEGLSDVLQQPSIFTQAKRPLTNEYQQVQYFKDNFNLVVS